MKITISERIFATTIGIGTISFWVFLITLGMKVRCYFNDSKISNTLGNVFLCSLISLIISILVLCFLLKWGKKK